MMLGDILKFKLWQGLIFQGSQKNYLQFTLIWCLYNMKYQHETSLR